MPLVDSALLTNGRCISVVQWLSARENNKLYVFTVYPLSGPVSERFRGSVQSTLFMDLQIFDSELRSL